jgi:hypothetical protein
MYSRYMRIAIRAIHRQCQVRRVRKKLIARVAKLVDARDLKSLGGNTVPVRVRPRAPDLNRFDIIGPLFLLALFKKELQ